MRALALLLAALVAGGCADAVDPTLGTDQVYSLYGYLDPTADRQAIRVVPITDTLAPDSAGALGATMTATEPATGRTAAWRDSLVTFPDGSRGNVYVADYTPTPGAEVVLRVAAPDGREAVVTVAVPPLAPAEVGEPTASTTGATYPVSVRDVPRVIGGTLRVFVTGLPADPGAIETIEIPVGRLPITLDGGAWTVRVPFLGAVRDHLQEIGLFRAGLELVEAEFAPFVANDAWAVPEGGFDLETIIEPGTFSNVAGGFGFVGAGYRSPVRWVPSTNVQSLAGFTVVNDPAAQVALNEVGDGYAELYNPTREPIDLTGYIVTAGTAAEGVRIAGGDIAAGGFLIVNGPFAATAGAQVQFLNGSGRLLRSVFVETTEPAWGAFPDGYSYQVPRGGPNLFYGPVRPSSGASNRPAVVTAVINEVSTSGDGYVEVVPLDPEITSMAVASSEEGLGTMPVGVAGSGPFRVADEGGGLVLDQIGGAVFLLVDGQVVDARFYGTQTPERSAGYLPDGPDGTWTPGLRPTRGAANAATRLGS